MPELAFVMSPGQSPLLGELAATLRYELERQGVPSTLHADGFPDPRPDLLYVLVGPHEYLELERERALPGDPILRRTILICAQRPNAVQREGNLDLARRSGAVFDIEGGSVAEWLRAGVFARHLRLGYTKLLDCFDPDAERPIDVAFTGAGTPRRRKQLGRCARILARQNCQLEILKDARESAAGSSTLSAEGKRELLTRAKILLNIHRGDGACFEWLRVLDAIHAGAVVVTEHSSRMGPLVPGEHLLVASPESLPFVVAAAVRDRERLARLRVQAYERIRDWQPLAMSVAELRGVAVDIVGRPVPPEASAGRTKADDDTPPERSAPSAASAW